MKLLSLLSATLLVGLAVAGFVGPRPVPAPEAPAAADVITWTVDKTHSNVGFKVKHLGISNVRGNFSDYDATITFDAANLSTLSAATTVRVASINTENERRDNHLRSPDFFAAEEFPEMTFVSKAVRNIDGNEFELVGDLTIRGMTKEVVLEGEFLGTTTMRGQQRAGFEAETTINRLDYGLAWDRVTEAGGFVVGHDVDIILELELIGQNPEAGTD